MDIVIQLILLVFSAIVHEVSHGVVAEWFGDDTAKRAGRLTLNPLPHLDWFYSILLPLLLYIGHSPVLFGAAVPVPVNFANMRKPRLGMFAVSLAGPLANFALAVLAGIILKLGLVTDFSGRIMFQLLVVNVVLGTFNLIPIPPLDGSKILASLGNRRWMGWVLSLERFGFILVFAFLLFGVLDKIISPVLYFFIRSFGLV